MTERIDVLHVDDDPAMADLTAAYLARELDAVEVTSVTDPTEALERLATGTDHDVPFDCIVSDYDMPGMNGLEFFTALREQHTHIPFILFTGKGSEEIASQALNAGVTGYFQKGGPEQQQRLAHRAGDAVEEYRTKAIADRYSTVMEALGYPIYVVDETGTFQFVNEAFAELTGYSVEEIVGSKPGLIKDDEAVAEAENRLGSILSSSGPDVQRFPVDIIPKEGEPIPCRDHMAVLPYEGEEFEGSVGILRDTSDEQRRREELETKRRAMDEAPVGITITDPTCPDNPMTYVNDRFVEMTGYDREEAVGVNCRFLQGPDTDPEPVGRMREAVEDGESVTVELLNYRKDGTEFWNRVSMAPIHGDDGEVTNWVGFQEDITDFVERERALERQNERLDAFASIVSHDLRNPLAVVKGSIEMAKYADDTAPLDRGERAAERIDQLITELLTLARQGKGIDDPTETSLTSVAYEAWETVDDDDASLLVADDPRVFADRGRLRQALENLFRNAVEHGSVGDAGVRVVVASTTAGFVVADDGPGIDPDAAEAVFEPGFTTHEEGTGYGLDIVREICEAHGWSVRVVTDGVAPDGDAVVDTDAPSNDAAVDTNAPSDDDHVPIPGGARFEISAPTAEEAAGDPWVGG